MIVQPADTSPILIVVNENNTWDAYTPEPITPRAEALLKLLYEAGGVSDKNAPGRYYFNATLMDDATAVCTFEPVEE